MSNGRENSTGIEGKETEYLVVNDAFFSSRGKETAPFLEGQLGVGRSEVPNLFDIPYDF